MNKRYVVTANYPNSKYKRGDIITDTIGAEYPDVFRELKWHERIKPDEMPKYLIVTAERVNGNAWKGIVIEVGKSIFWNSNEVGVDSHGNASSYGGIMLNVFEPISEEEYNQIKSEL